LVPRHSPQRGQQRTRLDFGQRFGEYLKISALMLESEKQMLQGIIRVRSDILRNRQEAIHWLDSRLAARPPQVANENVSACADSSKATGTGNDFTFRTLLFVDVPISDSPTIGAPS
jgi:hypothetical protein